MIGVVYSKKTINKERRIQATLFALRTVGALILLGLLILGSNIAWHYLKNKNSNKPEVIQQALVPKVSAATPDPTSLSIPSLKINAPFVEVGLNADKSLQTPDKPNEVGWFAYRPKPGDIGPAVVVGHFDTAKGPAVFQNLKNIKPGDNIIITRADGSTVTYRTDSVTTYSQDNFPTDAVYGNINYAGLRLITCSGTYSKKVKHYSDNLVVYASLIH